MAPDATILIEQMRRGSDAAWRQLLDRYSNYLLLLCRVQIGRQVQGKVDPADVVQETFLDAHRQIRQFRGESESELLAWLRQILAGQMALVLRKYLGTKGRDVNLEQNLANQLDESSQALDDALLTSQSTPSQHASRREQAMVLANALAKLPADYREVIFLRHVEGLAFSEVSRRMGRSEDSVQKLWLRALANMRQSLGEPKGTP